MSMLLDVLTQFCNHSLALGSPNIRYNFQESLGAEKDFSPRVLVEGMAPIGTVSLNFILFLDVVNTGYDFESDRELAHVTDGRSSASIDSIVSKHGTKSLRWAYHNNPTLTINLTPQQQEQELMNMQRTKKRKTCGIYFWIYQDDSSIKHDFNSMFKMHVTLYLKKSLTTELFTFQVNLGFHYWRAIARRLPNVSKFSEIQQIRFDVLNKTPQRCQSQQQQQQCQHQSLNFDLLRISDSCFNWSYDMINPPQLLLADGNENEILGKEDLDGDYNSKNFWQQIYKWRKIDLHRLAQLDGSSELTLKERKQLDELSQIERRTDDWFYPSNTAISTLDRLSKLRLRSMYDCKHRWSHYRELKDWYVDNTKGNFAHARFKRFKSKDTDFPFVCVQSAHKKYQRLSSNRHLFPTGNNSYRVNTPLFASRDVFPLLTNTPGASQQNGMKFSEVTYLTLLPLAFEFYISKIPRTERHTVMTAVHNTLETSETVRKTVKKELKYDKDDRFRHHILSKAGRSLTDAFDMIDSHRLERLVGIFEYLHQQGWVDGSAVGNADHLLNLNCGFTQSLYILRNYIRGYTHCENNNNSNNSCSNNNTLLFKTLLNTSRWYLEIGEIHQKVYKHRGSTTDKIRTAMPSRLLLILATPSSDIKNARVKINDAVNLKRWVENSLEINEGYGGIIKPDFIGFHHKGV